MNNIKREITGRNPCPPSKLINRNVQGVEGRTSLRLSLTMWKALDIVAKSRNMTINEIIQYVQLSYTDGQLTSNVRDFLLETFMDRRISLTPKPAMEILAMEPPAKLAIMQRALTVTEAVAVNAHSRPAIASKKDLPSAMWIPA